MDVLEGPGQTILYRSSFKEPVLVSVHNFQDDSLKTVGEKLGNKFEAAVEEGDRSIVIDY